jgi:hypothetical protein
LQWRVNKIRKESIRSAAVFFISIFENSSYGLYDTTVHDVYGYYSRCVVVDILTLTSSSELQFG